jgi:HD-GYP domain-containing protein (c-di-GMP phosphodiesterase class II)
MSSSRLNITFVSKNKNHIDRMMDLAKEFNYSVNIHSDAKEIMEYEGKYDLVQVAILDVDPSISFNSVVETLQMFKFSLPHTFICVVLDGKASADNIQLMKKSGSDFVILEPQFMQTCRLEFITSQIIRAAFIPVKVTELALNTSLDFTLYHLMPLNQKMLPVLPKGTTLTAERSKKFESVSELFIKREEVDAYNKYIQTNADKSAKGLTSRCRSQYLSLCFAHSRFIFNLIDQSENASFKEGRELISRCETLAQDLLATLSAVGEAWEVVNNSSLGEMGSVERSPTLAAYAGLFALTMNLSNSIEIMMACLLADIGMLDLSPKAGKKIRSTGLITSLSTTELSEYKSHPKTSVQRCLDKKLAMDDKLREMILNSHERADGTGFPEGKPGAKISIGAMLIHFCELVDKTAMIKMGQARVSVEVVRKKIIQEEITQAKTFSYTFLQQMRPLVG